MRKNDQPVIRSFALGKPASMSSGERVRVCRAFRFSVRASCNRILEILASDAARANFSCRSVTFASFSFTGLVMEVEATGYKRNNVYCGGISRKGQGEIVPALHAEWKLKIGSVFPMPT